MEPPIHYPARSSSLLPFLPPPSRNSITAPAASLSFPLNLSYKAVMVRYGQKERGAQKDLCVGNTCRWCHWGSEMLPWNRIHHSFSLKTFFRIHETWSMYAVSLGAAANIVLWAFVWAPPSPSNRQANKQISLRSKCICREGAWAGRMCVSPQFFPRFLSHN